MSVVFPATLLACWVAPVLATQCLPINKHNDPVAASVADDRYKNAVTASWESYMPGELVPRYSSGQLQRATRGALNEVAARQLVTEAIIRAKSQVGEYAASEAVYLKAIQKIAETSNPDCTEAVAAIINMTVAGIIRTNGEFGASL